MCYGVVKVHMYVLEVRGIMLELDSLLFVKYLFMYEIFFVVSEQCFSV